MDYGAGAGAAVGPDLALKSLPDSCTLGMITRREIDKWAKVVRAAGIRVN